jgi:hypothetical protein
MSQDRDERKAVRKGSRRAVSSVEEEEEEEEEGEELHLYFSVKRAD